MNTGLQIQKGLSTTGEASAGSLVSSSAPGHSSPTPNTGANGKVTPLLGYVELRAGVGLRVLGETSL